MNSREFCNGCKSFKLTSEFISYGAKGIKQLKTCKNCRKRFDKKRKTHVETENSCQSNILEIVDIDFLSELIINLLEDNNQELYLHCHVSNTVSTDEISIKELAN